MITVLGGGIVNLVPTSDETVLRAVPGGSAFSIAIEAARLGFPTALMVRLSRDPLGQMLRRHAEESGIDLSASPEADEPTTIALVPACRPARNGSRREGHARRAARGSLYVQGTASWQWSPAEFVWIRGRRPCCTSGRSFTGPRQSWRASCTPPPAFASEAHSSVST